MDSYTRLLNLKNNNIIKKNNKSEKYTYAVYNGLNKKGYSIGNNCFYKKYLKYNDDIKNYKIDISNIKSIIYGDYFYYSLDNINWINVKNLNNSVCGEIYNNTLYIAFDYYVLYTNDMINFYNLNLESINSKIKNIYFISNFNYIYIYVLTNNLIIYQKSFYIYKYVYSIINIINNVICVKYFNNILGSIFLKYNDNNTYSIGIMYNNNDGIYTQPDIFSIDIDNLLNIDNFNFFNFYYGLFYDDDINFYASTYDNVFLYNSQNNIIYNYFFSTYEYNNNNTTQPKIIYNTNLHFNYSLEGILDNCIGIEYLNTTNNKICIAISNSNKYAYVIPIETIDFTYLNKNNWITSNLDSLNIDGITPYKTYNYNNILYVLCESNLGKYYIIYYTNNIWNILLKSDKYINEYKYII